METNKGKMKKTNLKNRQTFSQSKFILERLDNGELESSKSTTPRLCSRMEFPTKGSNTSMKRSMSSSKAKV